MRGIRYRSVLALLAIAVMVALAAGCGGDDAGSGQEGAQAEQAAPTNTAEAGAEAQEQEEALARKRAEVPNEEEVEAEEAVSDFYAILGADRAKKNPDRTTVDSQSFCDLMSEQAREQTVHYAKVSSGIAKDWDCESAVDLLVLRSKRLGGFENTQGAEVIGVNAEGDRATATVRFGDGPATSISLIREDGEWKLAATPAGG